VQTLSSIRIIATGLSFQEMPSLLIEFSKIHNLHNLHTLQCTVPTVVLPAAPDRHEGRTIADKQKTSGSVAGGSHCLGGLIKANRIHCSVRVWAERHKWLEICMWKKVKIGSTKDKTSEVCECDFIYPRCGPCRLSSITLNPQLHSPTFWSTKISGSPALAVRHNSCDGCLEQVDPN